MAVTPTRKRHWIRTTALLLGALIILLAGVGYIYETSSLRADLEAFPPPGRLIDVGGYHLHLSCTGEARPGVPTVLLEAGAGNSSLAWQFVQPDLAAQTRTCSYDRAGFGWSESTDTERTADQIVAELHTLLERAGESGPVVLVAHSFGGIYSRLYAQRYPDDVVGMVLVDSGYETLLSPFPEDLPLGALKLCKTLAPFGIVRAARVLDANPEVAHLGADLRPPVQAHMYRTDLCGNVLREYQQLETAAQQILAGPDLGARPLVVLTAGNRPADDWPAEPVWQSLQAELTSLSTTSHQVMATDSTHYINLVQPYLVREAVQWVLQSVQAAH